MRGDVQPVGDLQLCVKRDRRGMQTRGPMRVSMVVPSTLCILVLVFAVLLALEVVNIQFNQRPAGSSERHLGAPPRPFVVQSTTCMLQYPYACGSNVIDAVMRGMPFPCLALLAGGD